MKRASNSHIFGMAKTFRNMQRLKEILVVFVKNGLEELVIKTKLQGKVPEYGIEEKKDQDRLGWGIVGHRLRLSFQELGPAFIKFGQLISSREDLFPSAFVQEMKRLQDDVNPMPFLEAEKLINKALGKSWQEVFVHILPQAIATASIASVFKGELKSGEIVVLKVKKPGIEKIIDQDFDLMSFIIHRLERLNKEIRYLGLSHHLEDFYRTIKQECDLSVELRNLSKLKNNYQKRNSEDILYFPKAYPELSNSEFLVIEFLDGTPFNKLTPHDLKENDLEKKLHRCTVLFFQSLFHDGFFHADLHGGNFFLLNKTKKIGLVDFGLVGHLSPQGRQDLILILYYLISGNFHAVVHQFLDVAEYETLPDIKTLTRDLEESLGPFIGLKVSEIKVNEMLRMLMTTLSTHEIFLPREWSTIFRAIITLDGLGRSIGFDINTFEMLEKELDGLKSSFLNKENLMQDALGAGRQGLNVLRTLPHHVNWFLRELGKRNYAFDIRNNGQNQAIKGAARAVKLLGVLVITSCFFLCGTFVIPHDYQWNNGWPPPISIIFYLAGLVGLATAFFMDKKS
ncbi:MAG: AarF/UbiB family protein [Bacteriovoracaceae bacterium]|nr:AarF/UbiB family protein [Bacteriovoracaceae bacterium]